MSRCREFSIKTPSHVVRREMGCKDQAKLRKPTGKSGSDHFLTGKSPLRIGRAKLRASNLSRFEA